MVEVEPTTKTVLFEYLGPYTMSKNPEKRPSCLKSRCSVQHVNCKVHVS